MRTIRDETVSCDLRRVSDSRLRNTGLLSSRGGGKQAFSVTSFETLVGDVQCRCPLQEQTLHYDLSDPGRNYRPPPLPPISARRPFSEREGGGVYIWKPPAAGFYTPPLFYTPPTPRRVFSGVGGWGCIKFGPVSEQKIVESLQETSK